MVFRDSIPVILCFNRNLTGRKWSFSLWPVSWEEWQNHAGFVKAAQDLENRLVFGFYPDVLVHEKNQALVLSELADSYLYKDVLMYDGLKKHGSYFVSLP